MSQIQTQDKTSKYAYLVNSKRDLEWILETGRRAGHENFIIIGHDKLLITSVAPTRDSAIAAQLGSTPYGDKARSEPIYFKFAYDDLRYFLKNMEEKPFVITMQRDASGIVAFSLGTHVFDNADDDDLNEAELIAYRLEDYLDNIRAKRRWTSGMRFITTTAKAASDMIMPIEDNASVGQITASKDEFMIEARNHTHRFRQTLNKLGSPEGKAVRVQIKMNPIADVIYGWEVNNEESVISWDIYQSGPVTITTWNATTHIQYHQAAHITL